MCPVLLILCRRSIRPADHWLTSHLSLLFLYFIPQWHSLSREEQSKYYEMANREKQLHHQLYPGWTARDNYAINQKKKKKKRDKSVDGGTLTLLSEPGITVCNSLHSLPAEPGSLKKCRARYGLDQQSEWCKPCR